MLVSKKKKRKTDKKKKAKKCLEQGKQVNITVIMNGILCYLDKAVSSMAFVRSRTRYIG